MLGGFEQIDLRDTELVSIRLQPDHASAFCRARRRQAPNRVN
jgi:hypothetical protein